MKCTDYCDQENHHMHRWCKICQIRDDFGGHQCKFGFGLGMIHPDMRPTGLVNNVFWTEPETVLEKDRKLHERVSTKTRLTFYSNEINKHSNNCDEKYSMEKRSKHSHSV